MLLYQGALSFEIWFQRDAPVQIMKEGLWRAAGYRMIGDPD
jgi:shikimate 5-dehydrogenase